MPNERQTDAEGEFVQVENFEIWGSALNEKTGMATLFLIKPDHLVKLIAEGVDPYAKDGTTLFDETDAAIELTHEQLHFALQALMAMDTAVQEWEAKRAWKARQN